MRLLAFFVLALPLAACPATDPSAGLVTTPSAQLLDYNVFVCDAMPVLTKRCSYTACHGNEDHAFRVYSPGKLRLGAPPTRDARDALLSADEIERNYESAVAMTRSASDAQRMAGDVDAIPLLRKPLAARLGGDEHAGVAIFPVYPNQLLANDTEFEKLLGWVGGAKETSPPSAECAAFFTALGVSSR